DNPKALRKLTIRNSSPLAILPQGGIAFAQNLNGRMLFSIWRKPGKPASVVDVSEFQLGGKSKPRRLHTIRLDEGATVQEMQFSPQRDAIAWLISKKGPLGHIITVQVSRLDGSGMRVIERIPTRTDDPITKLPPQSLRWTVDGKNLGFIYDSCLWMVRAK